MTNIKLQNMLIQFLLIFKSLGPKLIFSKTIGFFDFHDPQPIRFPPNGRGTVRWNGPIINNDSVGIQDLPAAVFRGNNTGKIPDQVTICSTIYFDLDDAQVLANNWSPRRHPVWAFSDQDGKVNMSFYLQQGNDGEETKEAASLSLSILQKKFSLGKLQ